MYVLRVCHTTYMYMYVIHMCCARVWYEINVLHGWLNLAASQYNGNVNQLSEGCAIKVCIFVYLWERGNYAIDIISICQRVWHESLDGRQ